MKLLIPLWLPIFLSAAAIWVISAIAWMALPHCIEERMQRRRWLEGQL